MSDRPATVSYTVRALRTATEQTSWYEGVSRGLGQQFAESLRRAEDLALSNPEGFRRLDDFPQLRAVVLRRFPHRLIYTTTADGILVVLIAHTARGPDSLSDH